MRVLHVTSSLDPVAGGVATAVATLATAQARLGLRPKIISTWVTLPATDTADNLRAHGVDVEMLKARQPRSWRPDLPRLAAAWAQSADVVHVHALWEQVQYHAARAARRAGTPYVITPHGMLAPWCMKRSNWGKRAYLSLRLRRNLDHAALIHYTSTAERDNSAWAAIRAAPVVEPNGLDLSEFTPLPAHGAFRSAYPALARRRIVLLLGRLHPKKGFDLLIPAFARANLPDTTLVLAGPDQAGYQRSLELLIRQHNLQDRVLFTGMLRGPQRIAALVDADLFCLPSYNENFGIVVAESLAAGTPTLVSDQVDTHSDVSEHRVGQVVPCDVPALAAALHRWMTDDALRADAASRAPAVARALYDADAVARRWAGHYHRLTATTSTPA